MKKFLPLYLAILNIALFSALILQHEWHLKNSQSMFVELMPVDPRSILQGDYMVLSYQLHFGAAARQSSQQSFSDLRIDDFENQSQVLSYVQLDKQRRVIMTSFDQRLLGGSAAFSKLVLKNPRNTFESLYPAANSFMFAEGLESCYRNAKFAELKVQENGEAVLVDLVDQQLNSLNCKTRKSWWQDS
ncbi:MAG TPA: GDYXXLXY domain-containing protein [Acinetobacter lwoffii]|uniref:GDYXXLXY domain-containing protein n=1 Tax=Acinetobacter lwoffii TaxID=28090 RepID=A0A9D2UR71_ACILW|nr:GDYXXLXY domain-containing protein [Acinetobacter lwoffii]